eukprot:251570_1
MTDALEEEDRNEQFEEDLQRNPYNVKSWVLYILSKCESRSTVRNLLCERAVKCVPGSYKVWFAYLADRVKQVDGLCVSDNRIEAVNNVFERSLTFMHKMPRIWIMYLEFLMKQRILSRTRHTFDHSLMALPITQHERIWSLYKDFIRQPGFPAESACRIFRRYILLEPNDVEDCIKYLKSVHRLDEAAVLLADVVNNEKFVSKRNKSKNKLWNELCGLMCKNPLKVTSLNVDAILRSAIRRYTTEIGRLWTSLADYYVRMGQFEKARDIYEEGINSVTTVRDFDIVFNEYATFEETMLSAKMQAVEEEEDDKEGEDDEKDDVLDFDVNADDFDLRLARFQNLLERRPLLVNSVLLRQNPHNVDQWMKRVKIFEERDKPLEVIQTYAQAVKTVDPNEASGRLHMLWVNFAKFYEEYNGDVENARAIFARAVRYPFVRVDDLASVWCEWSEMELRNEHYDEALGVLQKATVLPSKRALYGAHQVDQSAPVQERVFKSTKLWSMYVDLEESFGTRQTTKAVYEKILDLRIATPQIIINYALFMEEHKYFEESFKVFEKGISLFKFPHVLPIWNRYLRKFVERYKGTKLERTRELFEQAVSNVPAKDAKDLYMLYAQFEEQYGLARHAMGVYDRACDAVQPSDQYDMFLVYIKRASDLFGATRSRDIYEKAIKGLPDVSLPAMCLRYARLEQKLGEVDRGRAIFTYGSQFADPRVEKAYWDVWREFEVNHGNQETYAEMLRVQRSISAQFVNVQLLTEPGKVVGGEEEDGKATEELNEIEKLEISAQQQLNPDEIDLDADPNPDEIDLEEEPVAEKDEEIQIVEKQVPDAVFGEAKSLLKRPAETEKPLGAMERLKKRKTA